ncbi:MAG TPA: regulatory iron-sulfur-containing complex subunit RicT [Crocinitomicaceae bacterium]|nr:regulatory iron-sulfur-containing complex subunit RicT [Crocinitomicaceae bacterium]
MGCTNCSSGGSSGGGCSGSCGSGGCKPGKLEISDWLANMTLPTGQKKYELVEVRFKNGRKHLFRNTKDLALNAGDTVVVEATSGYDVGVITLMGELVKIQQEKKYKGTDITEFKKIHRSATQEDIDKWRIGQERENELMHQSRKMAVALKLEMKISDVEYQGDLTKATFYYTAEGRVDFRQLIKNMADSFKVKIEMRQIGARQEASRLGGIGSCGRELCCTTWLTDFRSVSTSAARYQQLSLNPQKLAGQCGKLKCCLNYELDMYLEGLKSFPNPNTRLKTENGEAYHIKTDIFKKIMWYAVSGSNALIGLSPESVNEIAQLNKKGQIIADLKEYEVELQTSSEVVVEKIGFAKLEDDESFNRLAKSLIERGNRRGRDRRPKTKDTRQKTEVKSAELRVKSAEIRQQTGEQNAENQSSENKKKKFRHNRNRKPNPNKGNNDASNS